MGAADPSTAEWLVAGLAAGLVVAVGALHLLRPVLDGSPATAWGRLAGFLLAVLAAGALLGAVVAGAAALLASGRGRDGPFSGHLLHGEADIARTVGTAVAAVLVPAGVVLGVLALAVVAVGRPSGLRLAAGVGCGAVIATAGAVVARGGGPVVAGAGWVALVLSCLAAGALLLDERGRRRQPRP